jgi:hypothetical protein
LFGSRERRAKESHEPSWELPFTPFTDGKFMTTTTSKLEVIVIREEGSNRNNLHGWF